MRHMTYLSYAAIESDGLDCIAIVTKDGAMPIGSPVQTWGELCGQTIALKGDLTKIRKTLANDWPI